ncbi:hypothetical protein J3E71DRAFT_186808 [Bipolaris maydis]|nr:hypothetical protein J3E71DRAFT_186808 [Bipolaris maydis]
MTEITSSMPMISDCTHAVSSSLGVKLPLSQNACPVCVITSQMAAVRAAQNHFLTRGGVFMSSSGDVKKHVIATRYWKKTKVALTNTIIQFEGLLNEPDLPVEDIAKLSEALRIWDDQKFFLGRVPGLRYVRGPDTPVPTEEDRERARVFMNWVRNTMKREMILSAMRHKARSIPARPPDKDQPGWQLVEPRSFSVPSLIASPPTALPQIDFYDTWQPTLAPFSPVLIQSPQQSSQTQNAETEHFSTSLATTTTTTTTTHTCPATPKSIFKSLRAFITPRPDHPARQSKHVRISPFVTISSEHLSTANPSPFKSLSRICTTAPHSAHTTAEHKRHKYTYFRRHPTYEPGVWASAEGSRKSNTSFYHAKPWAVEMYVGRELKREERERKVAVQLGRDGREWMLALAEARKMDVQGVKLERLVVWLERDTMYNKQWSELQLIRCELHERIHNGETTELTTGERCFSNVQPNRMKELNRLVHGPNIHALNWTTAVTNVRTGASTTVRHHCSQGVNHARTAECYGDLMHQSYCPCWEYSESNGWYRCGLQQMVMSTACKKHRDDEMRKVFDKLRKGYSVYGWELNRPGSEESTKCSESKIEAIVEASKAEEEEIEKQLKECGEVDENVFVYAQMKKREGEKRKERMWQRKDEKERARLGK